MRVPVEIDVETLRRAEEVARCRRESLGATLAALIRRGLDVREAPEIEMRDGVPVLTNGPGALPLTPEMVRQLLDE